MVRRAAQAGLILLLAALLLGLAGNNPAQAHARLVRSDPPDNAILPIAPQRVQLWFSEAITPNLSSARLLDINGRELEGVKILTDPAQPAWIAVELPALADGVFSLNWKVFSAVDGHYNQGVLVFGIGEGANIETAGGGEQGEQPAPWEVAARWLNYLGLAGLIGALGVFKLPLEAGDSRFAIQRRLTGWMALCIGLAWLAGWGLLAGQMQFAPALETLLATRWGGLWLARQGVLLLGLGLVLWQRKNIPTRFSFNLTLSLLLFFTLGVVALQALNSHAASAPGETILPLLVDGLHLVAIGLWAGGVLALLAIAWPPRLLNPDLVHRFTPWAILWVGFTFASGLFSSAQQVASLDALLFTSYGQALLVKVVLVLGAGALGLINMRHAKFMRAENRGELPEKSVHPFGFLASGWRSIALEGGVILAVLVLTALLTSSAPANAIEYRLAGVEQPELLSQSVDDLLVSFSVRPNRPGQNIVSVRANSTRRPAPAEIQRVILRLRYLEQDLGQVTLEAEALQASPGQYQVGGSAFSLPGRWEVEVVVRRKGLLDSVARFEWVVFPLGEMPALQVAAFPLAWLAFPAAGAILLGIGGIIIRRGLRRKRNPPAG